MTKPVVATVWSGGAQRHWIYQRMAKVWKYSARKVFGDSVDIICRELSPPDMTQPCPVFMRGNRKIGPSKSLHWRQKIREWNEVIKSAEVGRPVLMTDVDMAFFSDPFPELPAAMGDADIGICLACTGAIYFSGSQRSHEFMEKWLDMTERLFLDEELYQELDRKHKGLDQASMQLLLENGGAATVVSLPLRFHSTCHNYELPCHLMHYHSKLRPTVTQEKPLNILSEELQPYSRAWSSMWEEISGTVQRK